jgi:hypothetical protein
MGRSFKVRGHGCGRKQLSPSFKALSRIYLQSLRKHQKVIYREASTGLGYEHVSSIK